MSFMIVGQLLRSPPMFYPLQRRLPKEKAKKPDQRVRFQAVQPAGAFRGNVIREECLDFTPQRIRRIQFYGEKCKLRQNQ
eukprot:5661493-Amphidinium_carterae.1